MEATPSSIIAAIEERADAERNLRNAVGAPSINFEGEAAAVKRWISAESAVEQLLHLTLLVPDVTRVQATPPPVGVAVEFNIAESAPEPQVLRRHADVEEAAEEAARPAIPARGREPQTEAPVAGVGTQVKLI
jgi:hypothetical protein